MTYHNLSGLRFVSREAMYMTYPKRSENSKKIEGLYKISILLSDVDD